MEYDRTRLSHVLLHVLALQNQGSESGMQLQAAV